MTSGWWPVVGCREVVVNQLGFPIVSLVLWLPALGALVLLFLPNQERTQRTVALGVGLATFVVSLLLYASFNFSEAGFQFVENINWIGALGIKYALSVDGVSLWFVLLATFLMPIVQIATWNTIDRNVRSFQALLLLLETAVIGTFVAQDLFLFYIFYELTLVPTALLIGRWGGLQRTRAATTFFLYNFGASLFMFAAIIGLYLANGQQTGQLTSDIGVLLANIGSGTLRLDPNIERLLFGGFFLAFAVKMPLWPFHTWLPLSHAESTPDGSIDIMGLLMKLGGYGLIRFCAQMLPGASAWAAPAVGVLSVIGILYGAIVAYRQNDMKRVLAYSTVSHMGFVVLGIFSLTQQGISGAILMMIASGIATGALFLSIGMIYARRGTRDVTELSGLWKVTPILGSLTLVAVFGSIGLPGLIGFPGEFTIMQGTWLSRTLGPGYIIVGVIGVILAAAYMLTMFRRAFEGDATSVNEGLRDIAGRELIILGVLAAVIVLVGLFPNLVFQPIQSSIAQISQEVTQALANR